MDSVEIEIPDNEDAACDMDLAELNMARKGAYDWAAACSGAARRLRADAEEIARLTAERDEAREQYRLAHIDWLSEAAQALNLIAELAAAIARAERAERVAVWAGDACCLRWGPTVENKNWLYWWGKGKGRELEYDGTDADLYRALVEACEGGRDHG